jgi:hypothetical protein
MSHSGANLPIGLILREHFPLGVVADDPFVDIAAYIQFLCPEVRHVGIDWGSTAEPSPIAGRCLDIKTESDGA